MNDFVPMIPADNPLVALAAKFGYTISIDVRALPPGGMAPRYRGIMTKGVTHYDNDLAALVFRLIEDDLASAHLAQPSAPQEPPVSGTPEQLQAQITDQQALIKQLELTIIDLKRQLELEHRYLIDTQARGFISFLKRQPPTTFIEKVLADRQFTVRTQAGRWTYEYLLRYEMHCREPELEEFKQLWKLLLLETPRND